MFKESLANIHDMSNDCVYCNIKCSYFNSTMESFKVYAEGFRVLAVNGRAVGSKNIKQCPIV